MSNEYNEHNDINTQLPSLLQTTPSTSSSYQIFSSKDTNSIYTNHFLRSKTQAEIFHSTNPEHKKNKNIYNEILNNARDMHKRISNEDFYKQSFTCLSPMTNIISSNDDEIEDIKFPHFNEKNNPPSSPSSKKKKQNDKKPINYVETYKQPSIANFFQ